MRKRRLMTTGDAAVKMGVSGATVRRWCQFRVIPSCKIGKTWLIDTEELEQFVLRKWWKAQ